MAVDLNLTSSRVRDLLEYNPLTGKFTHKVSKGGMLKGSIAGTYSQGYRYLSIDNSTYLEHRVAWLYVYNTWPDNTIDHIDMDGSNNKISNLRDATYTQNNQNRPSVGNANVYRGVYKSGSKYAAHIKVDGISTYLGTYITPEEASFVYENKAREVHKEFYNNPKYSYIVEKTPVPCVQKSATGYKGVRASGTKFKAVIKIRGQNIHIGTYATVEEASDAFLNKKKEIGRL